MTTQLTNDKAKNQGFLCLGLAACALFGVVPGLVVAGLKVENPAIRETLGFIALMPALGGIVFSILGLLLLSQKIKPLKGATAKI
jgi:hypothetical protein